FITDEPTYKYMYISKGGLPSVCSVSSAGKVLAFNHLKQDNLDLFFKSIAVNFTMALVRKTPLKNNTVSAKKCRTMIPINHNYYAFHPGVNLICKYNSKGENIQNKWI